MLPIFVVSLTRSADRRELIKKQMTHLDLIFEFIDAVDGKALTDEQLSKIDTESKHIHCDHKLSMGEFGCALSHLSIYEKMVTDNIEKCIILEDDIYIHSSFKKIINKINIISNSDITFLHHGRAKSWPLKYNLPNEYRYVKYRKPRKNSRRCIFSTAGYILTISGAKKLLSIAYPVSMPADYLTGKLQFNNLSASGVEPCCLDVELFPSSIVDRNYESHN